MPLAPEFSSGKWLNSPPLSLARLRGRALLLDFWNTTCLDCLHALPTIQRWQARYAEAGLTVIGIHTPEFAFGREQTQIEWANHDLGIDFPVLLDSEYQEWNAYANEVWPTYLLIDQDGVIRFQSGLANRELERAIQRLLREIDPVIDLPPVREDDPLPRGFLQPPPELFGGVRTARSATRRAMPGSRRCFTPCLHPNSAAAEPSTSAVHGRPATTTSPIAAPPRAFCNCPTKRSRSMPCSAHITMRLSGCSIP